MRDDKKIKEEVKQQFGTNAEKYVNSQTHATGEDLSLLTPWLNPSPDWVFLDVATGGGHLSKAIAPHVGQVFATDLTQPMLAAARNHLRSHTSNVFYVVADAEALPFLSESFDAVGCRIAAHHFPNPEAFVKEVARVLKPGGKFVLIDNIAAEDEKLDRFVNTLEKLRDHSHVRSYSRSEWLTWIEQEGLVESHSRIRKKTFPYATWVRRTTETEEQVEQVTAHITSADEVIQAYFAVEKEGEQVVSIQVDEWMALFEKPE
ncbi:class I SAM-dependent methyltransferase [Brevibacillus sp. M2.1A]|uniref:class I SAM-dependent methyltransferase n=1 Tax=Brevibacillus TaxID=55080 RepID=UPI00156B7CFE|nr:MULTISPECIES: class I SAM-dependent methyltransferase [Brevibacillus]MBY0085364.1 class I SAM-dependent methyltransferase [Brevibacillus brevis]MCC8434669.1 class I SAM-dependent methyltransferase [Brevibacillus sp. M2.1A]UKK97070.1 class I SAM-dependent methyltransferase [Brevibacillus brevis]